MAIIVRELASEPDIENLAKVVAEAFLDYPVMIRAFAEQGADRERWIQEMVRRSATARLKADIPTLLAESEGLIVGGAFVGWPNRKMPEALAAWWDEFAEQAGPATRSFFDGFVAAAESIETPTPHVHLTMIGIHPEYQGRGVGRLMIEEVATRAAEIEDVRGITLDTEILSNVALYERCGFRIAGETVFDDLPIWVMFREVR